MGGREAIRGFAVQTLICLLDALETDDKWIAVTIEPDSDHDKVDLLWDYKDRKKAVQVKSSQNPIGRGEVARWCAQLKKEHGADSYELRLAGPISAGTLRGQNYDGVLVPPPSSIIVRDLMEQAVTKLDRYLVGSGIDAVPLPVRMSLVDICAAKLILGSVTGTKVERAAFHGWLLHWITAAYPEALSSRLSANCEVLWGSLEFSTPQAGTTAFKLSAPLSVYNAGRAIAIVEWFLILVQSNTRRMIYRASSVGEKGKNIPFSAFAVGAGQVHNIMVSFAPVVKEKFETTFWPLGNYEIELIVKYSSDQTPRSVNKANVEVTGDHMALVSRTGAISTMISTLDGYLDGL
jgi:hypothetical protein